MNKAKHTKLTLILTLLLPVFAQANNSKPSDAVTVVSERVEMHSISQDLSLIGNLEASESVIISPEVAGKVDIIAVEANQTVKKGQLLVKLNDDQAQAAVKEAKAYLDDERRKLKEYQGLIRKGAVTQTALDSQKASADIALARLETAEADVKDLHISAPFDGTVGFIDFSRGKMLAVGTELLTLDDLSLMQVDLLVPERYLSMLSVGMKVQSTTEAWEGEVFEGELIAIDSRINSETLNLRVRIEFQNEDRKLKPGLLMTNTLTFPEIKAPIIPVQALEYAGTKRYVYIIGDDNKVTRTEVILGTRVENKVVIEQGLKIGDRIVVQGLVNMRDGVTVKALSTEASSTQTVTEEQQ